MADSWISRRRSGTPRVAPPIRLTRSLRPASECAASPVTHAMVTAAVFILYTLPPCITNLGIARKIRRAAVRLLRCFEPSEIGIVLTRPVTDAASYRIMVVMERLEGAPSGVHMTDLCNMAKIKGHTAVLLTGYRPSTAVNAQLSPVMVSHISVASAPRATGTTALVSSGVVPVPMAAKEEILSVVIRLGLPLWTPSPPARYVVAFLMTLTFSLPSDPRRRCQPLGLAAAGSSPARPSASTKFADGSGDGADCPAATSPTCASTADLAAWASAVAAARAPVAAGASSPPLR